MAAGDLTTLATLEQWLGLASGNADEALLGRLITAASGFIENWCGRKFVSQAYTETRDGPGGSRLIFAHSPVTVVASVVVDDIAIPAGTPGYHFTDLMIDLSGYRFTAGRQNVALSYTAGYAVIPAELEQACIELCAFRYRELDRIGISSKGMAGESTSFVIKDVPDSVIAALVPYRKVISV